MHDPAAQRAERGRFYIMAGGLMSDAKISGLPAVTLPVSGVDVLPLVQGGVTKKLSVGELFTNPATPSAAGNGIKVNQAAPSFGWRDITAEVDTRGTGANDPTFNTYTGTSIRALQFSATVMQECFVVFHVPHDWVPGTDIYFHAHWSNAAAVPNTGNVVWKFDYSFAKGFGQGAFPAVSTAQVIAASPAVRYTHNISETSAVTIADMEVDGLILVRCYRAAANVLDTCTDAVFLHTVDIHYQSTNLATLNKAPNFYG